MINGVPYAFFHAPGDPELNFEGGLQKIALRSTFTSGNRDTHGERTGSSERQCSADLGCASRTPAIATPGDHRSPGDTAVTGWLPGNLHGGGQRFGNPQLPMECEWKGSGGCNRSYLHHA